MDNLRTWWFSPKHTISPIFIWGFEPCWSHLTSGETGSSLALHTHTTSPQWEPWTPGLCGCRTKHSPGAPWERGWCWLWLGSALCPCVFVEVPLCAVAVLNCNRESNSFSQLCEFLSTLSHLRVDLRLSRAQCCEDACVGKDRGAAPLPLLSTPRTGSPPSSSACRGL